jgi:UDP-N-acetylmuramyl pentapeptide synthase
VVSTDTTHPISIEALAKILGAAVMRRSKPDGMETALPCITGVSTDSRTINPGDCFFAIGGDNFDGHSYVAEVFRKGAACVSAGRSA